jgi:SAM-dependent methyltransferase
MNWRYKAALQIIFSNFPFGEQLNYLCQRYVTRTLPYSDQVFIDIVRMAAAHISALKKYSGRRLTGVTFFEFGAGVTLTNPLVFYAWGIDRQIIFDITRIARKGLILDTINRFQRLAEQLDIPRRLEKPLDGEQDVFAALNKFYGIDYRAPADARFTNFDAGSVDFITSTNTLEHVPCRDVKAIFRECLRILRAGGLMSFRIDYRDHYVDCDPRISAYNFLRYSDRRWKVYSPSLHYQNRLRHRDYIALAEREGFELVEERLQGGTASDLEIIHRIPLNERFRAYRPDELAVRNALIVLRKGPMG